MTNYYRADAVTVNDVLFESLPTALAYITDNYAEWCGIRHADTTLASVEYENSTVWVKYTHDDVDDADYNISEEPFDVKYLEIITTV